MAGFFNNLSALHSRHTADQVNLGGIAARIESVVNGAAKQGGTQVMVNLPVPEELKRQLVARGYEIEVLPDGRQMAIKW